MTFLIRAVNCSAASDRGSWLDQGPWRRLDHTGRNQCWSSVGLLSQTGSLLLPHCLPATGKSSPSLRRMCSLISNGCAPCFGSWDPRPQSGRRSWDLGFNQSRLTSRLTSRIINRHRLPWTIMIALNKIVVITGVTADKGNIE